MREPDTRAAPRLRFTKDEMQAKAMPDSSATLKKVVRKETKSKPVDSARANLETKNKNAFPDGQKAALREPLTEEETATPAEETIPAAQADTFPTVQNSQPSKTKLKTRQKKPLSSGLHFNELPAHRTKKSDVQTEKKKLFRRRLGSSNPSAGPQRMKPKRSCPNTRMTIPACRRRILRKKPVLPPFIWVSRCVS